MKMLTLWRAQERLSRTLASWQLGAIGLLAPAVNMAQWAWIAALEQRAVEDYVNGAYRDETPIGKLMHDFRLPYFTQKILAYWYGS